MAPSRDRILATATTFITNFNKESPDAVVENRTATCIHEVKPDMNGFSQTYTNDEYLNFWKTQVLVAMPNGMHLSIDAREPVIDELNRRVVLYVRSKAETIVGPYENSYVWNLSVSEDGFKIDHVVEFVDSKSATDFVAKVTAAAAAAGAAASAEQNAS